MIILKKDQFIIPDDFKEMVVGMYRKLRVPLDWENAVSMPLKKNRNIEIVGVYDQGFYAKTKDVIVKSSTGSYNMGPYEIYIPSCSFSRRMFALTSWLPAREPLCYRRHFHHIVKWGEEDKRFASLEDAIDYRTNQAHTCVSTFGNFFFMLLKAYDVAGYINACVRFATSYNSASPFFVPENFSFAQEVK